MQELYFPEAIVLDREDVNGFDSRYSIYAKGFGKFFAKAKSVRKILSKLSGHLEPGSLIRIRLVGNGGLQVVDALKFGKVAVNSPDLYLLNRLLPEADFDFELWEILLGSRRRSLSYGGRDAQNFQVFPWKLVLKILGWDPEYASCQVCGGEPIFFVLKNQSFGCDRCLADKRELISVV